MDKVRGQIIINNLLAEICLKTDIKKDQYESWLINEVGLTKAEIKELKEADCLPLPL